MAIRRKRIDRTVDLKVNENNRVVDLPAAWKFDYRCLQSNSDYSFDFNQYCGNGRDALAEQLRDAVWSLRHESTGAHLECLENIGIRKFWKFLDALEAAGTAITRPDQIDRNIINQYLTWLDQQIATKGPNKGRPLAFGSKKIYYDRLKALLVNRQKRVPEAVSSELSFPVNPFPNSNKKTPKRKSYSITEQERILAALKADLKLFKRDSSFFSARDVLGLHAAIIAFLTGVNVTPLLEARRDALKPFLSDRELLVLFKRRGWSTHSISLRKEALNLEKEISICPNDVGGYFRQLCAYTEQFQDDTEDSESVFIYRMTDNRGRGTRVGEVVRMDINKLHSALTALVKRHGLLDDQGHPLKLNLARIRPTFASILFRRTRDIRKVQMALGHSNPNITAQRYVDGSTPESVRDHAFVGQAMVDWATDEKCEQVEKLAADGEVPLKDAKELLKGGYNTGVARCKNPFRENGETCGKFLHCFKCRSMVVFEDDLYRLFSFYYRLLSERVKIAVHQWMKTYGWVIKVIDNDIAPQFDEVVVQDAMRKAQENPHPAWATGAPLL